MSDNRALALAARAELARRRAVRQGKEDCERSLYTYLQAAWAHFDPAPFTDGWHIAALCEHLEAVSRGEIKRLLINIPPRHAKTSIVAIAWPTWTWLQQPDPDNPLLGPGVRFLCASYGANPGLRVSMPEARWRCREIKPGCAVRNPRPRRGIWGAGEPSDLRARAGQRAVRLERPSRRRSPSKRMPLFLSEPLKLPALGWCARACQGRR
jgi:hypothetical protein